MQFLTGGSHGRVAQSWLVEQSVLKALWVDYRRLFVLLHARWLLLLPIAGLVAGLAVSPWAGGASGGGRWRCDLPEGNSRCLGLSVVAGALTALFMLISFVTILYPLFLVRKQNSSGSPAVL